MNMIFGEFKENFSFSVKNSEAAIETCSKKAGALKSPVTILEQHL